MAAKKSGGPGGLVVAVLIVLYLAHSHGKLPSLGSFSSSFHGGSATVRSEQRYAQQVFGNDSYQQDCLVSLWNQESGWNADAVNNSSGAYGIPQALPSAQGHPFSLGDWQSQIQWGHNYIMNRYGSPCNAWSHEQSYNWY